MWTSADELKEKYLIRQGNDLLDPDVLNLPYKPLSVNCDELLDLLGLLEGVIGKEKNGFLISENNSVLGNIVKLAQGIEDLKNNVKISLKLAGERVAHDWTIVWDQPTHLQLLSLHPTFFDIGFIRSEPTGGGKYSVRFVPYPGTPPAMGDQDITDWSKEAVLESNLFIMDDIYSVFGGPTSDTEVVIFLFVPGKNHYKKYTLTWSNGWSVTSSNVSVTWGTDSCFTMLPLGEDKLLQLCQTGEFLTYGVYDYDFVLKKNGTICSFPTGLTPVSFAKSMAVIPYKYDADKINLALFVALGSSRPEIYSLDLVYQEAAAGEWVTRNGDFIKVCDVSGLYFEHTPCVIPILDDNGDPVLGLSVSQLGGGSLYAYRNGVWTNLVTDTSSRLFSLYSIGGQMYLLRKAHFDSAEPFEFSRARFWSP